MINKKLFIHLYINLNTNLMKNSKKISRNDLKKTKGGEGNACYCTGSNGTTFMGYTYNPEGCYYACTKSLVLQPN